MHERKYERIEFLILIGSLSEKANDDKIRLLIDSILHGYCTAYFTITW